MTDTTNWFTWLANLVNPNENLTMRRWKIYSIAFNVFRRFKFIQWRTKGMSDDESQPYWDDIHEANAKEIYNACVQMEGLLLKAGQYISTRADVMPVQYLKTLGTLTDSVPPKKWTEVAKTLKEELGEKRWNQIASIDQTPLATASIAQVHRGKLVDGTDIVLKVQHRNVAARVMQDLTNLREVINLVAKWEPNFDFRPIFNEWAKELPQELSFLQELKNMEDVEKGFQEWYKFLESQDAKPEHEFRVKLAETFPELSTDRVLVMKYIEGIRLSDKEALKKADVDLAKLNRQITRAYAHQLFVQGNFNADPHSGNFIVAKQDSSEPWIVYLLDFGLVKRLEPNERRGLSKMLVSAADLDFTGLLSSLEEIGLKILVDDPHSSMKIVRFLFRSTAPSEEARKESEKHRKEWEQQQKKNPTPPLRTVVDAFPGCLVLFGRVLNLLRGLSSVMANREDYLSLMAPFARQSLLHDFERQVKPIRPPGPDTLLQKRLKAKVAELEKEGLILGLQVAVHQQGKPIGQLTTGFMGSLDPRYMDDDSLTNCFSVTKALLVVTLHSLVQQGKIQYDDLVVKHWPEFCKGEGDWNGKETTKISDVLQHRAGLSDVATMEIGSNPAILQDWEKMVEMVEQAKPTTRPGSQIQYHFFSYAWVVGGLIEHITKEPLMTTVKRLAIEPIGQQENMFVGIPTKGVDQRLTSISMDFKAMTGGLGLSNISSIEDVVNPEDADKAKEAKKVEQTHIPADMGGVFRSRSDASRPVNAAQMLRDRLQVDPSFQRALVMSNPMFFNDLKMRRAIIPSANGHFTAEALASFYDRLCQSWQGQDSTLSKDVIKRMMWGFPNPGVVEHDVWEEAEGLNGTFPEDALEKTMDLKQLELYRNALVHLAMGGGLMRYHFYKEEADGLQMTIGAGHGGFGGSLALCLPSKQVSIAIVVTKLDITAKVTRALMNVISEELNLGKPLQFDSGFGGAGGIEAEHVEEVVSEAPLGELV